MASRPLLVFLLLFPVVVYSQISGKVLTAKDSTALQGVSVYFDGTSIGSVTNEKGEFSLHSRAAAAPLVISYLGYEQLLVHGLQKGEKTHFFYLQEKTEHLAEVLIEPDPWSRERKLRTFTREFFGPTPAAAQCRITNPEVLELHYSPSEKILTATSKEPLRIINRHLGYEISYHLASFEAQFSTGSSGLSFVHMVSYEGTTFFENLRKTPRKKHSKNRQSSYLGSSLHFMRSLAKKQLEENQFHIYFERFRAAPYVHFKITEQQEVVEVELMKESVSILYSGIEQSTLQTHSAFTIDALGNHSPPLAVLFGGEMSAQRVAHLLPLDYWP